jgi:NADH-quinone oxidoreductase subunit N
MLLALYQISFHAIYISLFYAIIYLFLTLSLFGVVFLFYKPLNQTTFYFVKDIKSVYMRSPILAYFIIFIAFSYAGIPPLAGFFSKLLVLPTISF